MGSIQDGAPRRRSARRRELAAPLAVPADCDPVAHQLLEKSVDAIADIRTQVADRARVALGVTGIAAEPGPVTTLGASPSGVYPVVAIGLLALTAELHFYGFAFLSPDIARELGVGAGSLLMIRSVVASLAALRLARNFQTRDDRAYMSIFTAAVWSALTLAVAFASGSPMLPIIGMALAASSVHALHPSLVIDSYPPEARVRALSYYRAFAAAGVAAAFVIVAIVLSLGYSWRVAFLAIGIVSVLAVAVSAGLRDPGFGRWDVDRVKDLVRAASGSNGAVAAERRDATQGAVPDGRTRMPRPVRRLAAAKAVPERDYFTFPDVGFEGATVQCRGYIEAEATAARRLRFSEITHRLLAIPTLRGIFAGWALLGALLTPLFGYVSFFLEDRWNMGLGNRGAVWAGASVGSIAALVWFAPRGERRFQEDPGGFLRFGARLLAVGVVAVAVAAFVPVLGITLALLIVGIALIGLVHPVLMMAMLAVVAPRMRPHASALASVFLAVVGALGGSLVLGGLDRRFGISVAIASLALPGLVVALQLGRAARTISDDLDALIDEVVNAEELAVRARRGDHVPLLSCRNVDFAYGQIQVLFDVHFTVDEGEMVALLGTNGSGKSTLLNAISGVGLPMRGSVIYEGNDITYLDAVRRVGLGIGQVPGGRAVFGPLTVVENLRTLGYTIRRDKRQIDAAMDRCFETFPRLAERRNQLASTLSGGEQQMLGLATALMLRPKLLLIDELSLGLAPVVVGQLLEAVRQINATGTAVVLVEQSVNIALTLVNHAYFMEKGEVRFDGAAAALLDRPDLVRSVFLEGAGAGMGRSQ